MPSARENTDLVSFDQINRSFQDFKQLRKQLPEDAVVALAREVLKSLARQMDDSGTKSKDVLELSHALVGPDNKAAPLIVERILKNGLDTNRLYLEYLSPASHQLGQWWDESEVSFADVTIGTGRIYAIMRALERRRPKKTFLVNKTALFALTPGEDHILGLRMASDMARKDGWHIELAVDDGHDALIERITSSKQLIIGLSAAGRHSVPNLARLVIAIRLKAPKAYIMVSGNVVDVAEESVRLMDVDGMARDYKGAMQHLDQFWGLLRRADIN